jgi:hypothetical protein
MPSTILSDNGVSSGSAGLKTTANSDGTLALQTTTSGGTATTALTINTTQAIGVGSTPSFGTSGQFLTSGGSGTSPTWTTAASSQWTTSGSNIYYNTGKVGVGTSSPSSALHISGTALSDLSDIKLQNTATSGKIWRIGDGIGGRAGSLIFYDATAGGERGGFNSNGYFKATNNGSYPDGADVASHYFTSDVSAGGSGDVVLFARADSTSFGGSVFQIVGNRNTTNSSFNHINCFNGNGSGKFIVRDSGNAVNTNNSYGAVSDISLKENIVDATSKLADLMQVRIRNYNLKVKPDEKQIGVVAQELETVFPSLVESDNEGIKNVKYSVFVPMLIKAMQEQQVLITAQAETITTITARIVALETRA